MLYLKDVTWRDGQISSVKVNGKLIPAEDVYVKANGKWVIAEEASPFNDALALVGYDPMDSIEAVLASSDACTALAGNAEAYTIMKDNYSAEMTTAIDSAWNDGLNTLNYKCKLKCYLYKAGNQCIGVSGGWTVKWAWVLAGAWGIASANDNNTICMQFNRDNGDGHYKDKCTASTKNSIDATGFSKISWIVTKISGQGKKQMRYNTNNYSDGITSTGTHSYTVKSGVQDFYWSNVPHSNVGTQECRISAVWLEP